MNSTSQMYQITRKINIFSTLLIVLLGVIGHLITIIVYSRKRFRTYSNHIYLLCLAINDSSFLIILVLGIESSNIDKNLSIGTVSIDYLIDMDILIDNSIDMDIWIEYLIDMDIWIDYLIDMDISNLNRFLIDMDISVGILYLIL